LAFSSEGRAEELRLKQNRDQGELLIQGEQVELSKKQHADNFALQYGKLEAETGINERKMVQDAELKREELDTKRTVETGKLLLADEKQQQDNEAAEREAEQAEYEKAEKAAKEEESSKQGADILVGLKEILESHQKESSENQQSLAEILKAVSEQQSTIMKTLTSPRKIVRGADGRVERMEIAG
jgi:hypothetical protein